MTCSSGCKSDSDGEVIKSVDGFKYLGSTITVDGSEEREVTRRIHV